MSAGTYPGLYEGLMIHRTLPKEEWRDAVNELPEELRDGAERYLWGIVDLQRSLIRMARDAGCSSIEEFEKLRREARRHGAPGARAWVKAGRPERWRNGGGADW